MLARTCFAWRQLSLAHSTSNPLSACIRQVSSSYVPGQPDSPVIKTDQIPGPKTLALKKDLSKMQAVGSINVFGDFSKSIGNFLADADGNMLLDLLMQISSVPIGYNHPKVIEACQNPANLASIVNRPALGATPPVEWIDKLHGILMSVAPEGLNAVQTLMCGGCSNEYAFKLAFYYHQRKKGVPPTAEDLESCLWNKVPGSPNLSILSFVGAFHGRTTSSLSCSHAKSVHKLDLPTLPWPHAPFPQLKYPLEDYILENKEEEARCIQEVEQLMKETKDQTICGIVVEPIQAEGGDNWASPWFFRELQRICNERDILFIVDEVQTGVAITGKMWAYEHWGLEKSPDIVVFAKKMISAGMYYRDDLIVHDPFRFFNTWMGDPHKMVILEAVLDVIKKDNLIQNMALQGETLKRGLLKLQNSYSHVIDRVRGVGCFLAFDGHSVETRDKILAGLRNKGVLTNGCGTKSIRLRPSAVIEEKHITHFLNTLEQVLSEL